jgi:peptidyl-prolyl cis-trans isomerase A (cyclophilin A)
VETEDISFTGVNLYSMRFNRKNAITLVLIVILLGSTIISVSSFFLGKETPSKVAVIMETSMGTIELELDPEKAPVTVANFVEYALDGHYMGTVFHRVMPGFMIQGGGMTSTGTEKTTRGPIVLESNNGLRNVRGAIAMARTIVPDSATCQFYINLVDNPSLDYRTGSDGYAVFGRVVKGMDVVDAIAGVETSSRGPYEDWPVQDVVIQGLTVVDE